MWSVKLEGASRKFLHLMKSKKLLAEHYNQEHRLEQKLAQTVNEKV